MVGDGGCDLVDRSGGGGTATGSSSRMTVTVVVGVGGLSFPLITCFL